MRCLALALTTLSICACSTARPRAASSPNLTGAMKRSQDITETISLASEDSKEIKKAITALQDSNRLLHKLNGETVLILDNNDAKLIRLMESK